MSRLVPTNAQVRLLIAGGGVAALEAVLALRALIEDRVAIELLGPEPHFWYRPLSVAEPFELGEAHRYELSALAAAAGASFTLGRLEGVDAAGHRARTSVGDVPYDILLVAIGAVPTVAIPGALTFRGPADSAKMSSLLEELTAGVARRLVFAAPTGAVWSLPLYELALMTAAHLGARGIQRVDLSLVTPEDEPLQLFGPAASDSVGQLLEERGIEVHTGTSPAAFVDGELRLVPDGRIEADRVVALPRLRGMYLDGLPQTIDGFVPVDLHGRVSGLGDVYAAGDITTFPIKQGGVAAQQADAVAQTIAAQFDVNVRPEGFRPVLRGLLLTGRQPRYLRHELIGGLGRTDVTGHEPLWWPPAKIAARHLAPFLAAFAGVEAPTDEAPGDGAISIDVDVTQSKLDLLTPKGPVDPEAGGDTVAEAMTSEILVVAPEDTLGEVAGRMRARDTGSAIVAEHGRLIGIFTTRDLLRAFAAHVHPSEARMREWMTAEPVTVPDSAHVAEAARLMNLYGIHHLPVVDGDRPVGMLGFRQAVALRGTGIGLGF